MEEMIRDNALEEQLINNCRAVLQELNEKYKGFYHLKVITIVPLEQDNNCEKCVEEQVLDMRVVVGLNECKEKCNDQARD